MSRRSATPRLALPRSSARRSYVRFLRSQLRFSVAWVPAVLIAGYIQWREGGFLRLFLVLLVGGPLTILAAAWWEWRKLPEDP